jgi:hypothetical protein
MDVHKGDASKNIYIYIYLLFVLKLMPLRQQIKFRTVLNGGSISVHSCQWVFILRKKERLSLHKVLKVSKKAVRPM